MSRLRNQLATLGLLGCVALPLVGQEPPRPEQPGPRPEPMMQRRMGRPRFAMGPGLQYAPQHLVDRREALSLTPDQVARLEALTQEVQQARESAEAEVRSRQEQLEQLWEQPAPDVNQLRTHAQAVMQAQQNAHLAALTAAARAKAVLSPEQRGRVAGWSDARRGMMERRMDRMRDRGALRGPQGPGFRRPGPRPPR